MPQIELVLGSGNEELSVRSFSVREWMSSLFDVSIEAVSPQDDIDFESVVGAPATLRIASGLTHAHRDVRRWAGICNHLEQIRAESTGLSSYRLHIVPRLWLLTQRRNYRIFQHRSVPEIVDELLSEWRIEAHWKITRSHFPKFEVRTQYGESDYAFISRLLEEAGISFCFHDDHEKGTALVLHDKPHVGEHRGDGPIRYVDNPSESAEKEYVTEVFLSQEVKPGHVTIRDFDFRRSPEFQLFGSSSKAPAPEGELEQYYYSPGAFLLEGGKDDGTPVADDKGMARHEEKAGKHLAERRLEAARVSRRVVSFKTNVIDLWPGVLFAIDGHGRSDLTSGKRLLTTEFSVAGSPGGEWTMSGRAVFADHAYRPPNRTPKPHIHSVQTAVVVGAKGEEIHTDEFGRVRVQFHWDRAGKFSDHSSCWMRVSQGWAGSGFGMMAIPRVGQEVLVGFLEGNPDQPVVVGRLYNNTSRVPYKLPDHKTVSGWKSDSTPRSEGFNELRFDDAKGRELVHVQAERNLTKLVKVDEMEATGANRTIRVGKTLTLTTGEASIILDGPTIRIEAQSILHMRSRKGDIVIEGGPRVKINPPELNKEHKTNIGQASKPKTKNLNRHRHGTKIYSKGIEVRGSAEFCKETIKALKELESLPTGRGLITKIARSEKKVKIVETHEINGYCKAEDLNRATRRSDGKTSAGCGSTVGFNPQYKHGGISSIIVLGQSLTHAYHNATGSRALGATNGTKNSDLKTIGIAPFSARSPTENALRRSKNLPLRQTY